MPRLERLESDDERDLSFDCGDADLNEFFFYDSKLVCRELIAVTYAWTDNDQTLAYFSISNDAIAREVDKAAYRRAARNIPHATNDS
jgi:hypothetical protein